MEKRWPDIEKILLQHPARQISNSSYELTMATYQPSQAELDRRKVSNWIRCSAKVHLLPKPVWAVLL